MRTALATLLLLLSTAGQSSAQQDRTSPTPPILPEPDVVVRPNFPGLASPPFKIRLKAAPIPHGSLDHPAIPPLPVRLVSGEKPAHSKPDYSKPAPPMPIDCPAAAVGSCPGTAIIAAPGRTWITSKQPLATSSITLRHVAAKKAVAKIQQQYATKVKPAGPRPIIIADPVQNVVHLIATQAEAKRIRKQIAKIDRAPKRYTIRVTMVEIGKDGKEKILSCPVITVSENQLAQIKVGREDGKVLEASFRMRHPASSGGPVHNALPNPNRHRKIIFRPQPNPARVPARTISKRPRFRSASLKTSRPAPSPQIHRKLEVRTYAVADLVFGPKKAGKQAESDAAKELIAVIQRHIHPKSWDEYGTIRYFSTNCGLVIRQTKEGHQLISDLLSHLRKLRDRSRKN